MEAIKLIVFVLAFTGQVEGVKMPLFFEESMGNLVQSTDYESLRKQIFETMALYGMKNNYALSYITALLAVREMEMGNEKKAETLYELSKEISPDMPTPSYLYARSMWKKGLKGFFESFVPQLDYTVKKYTNPITSIELSQLWWEELFYFSIIFSALFALIIGIRFIERIYHFFWEWLSVFLSDWGIWVFIGVIIAFPFVIGVPAGYLIVGYIVFFTLFSMTKEWKVILLSIISIGIFSLSAFFVERASVYMTDSNFSYFLTILNYHSGNWDALSKGGFSDTPKLEEMFINGVYNLKMGRYEKAYIIFDELLKRNYKVWKCYNNMGIASYALGRKDDAFSNFQKSLKLRPLFNPEAYYNISVIYFERADVEEGEKAINKAREEMGETVDKFKAYTSKESINTIFIPSELSPSEMRDGLSKGVDMSYVVEKFSFLFPDFNLDKIIATCSIAVLIILISLIPFIRNAFPKNCSRCGKVYCARCEESPLPDLCYSCYTIYIIKEKISPDERVQIELETSRRLNVKKWIRWALNFVFPGAGDLYSGKEITGVLKMLIIILVVISFFMGRMLRGVIPFSLELTPFEYGVRIIFILFIWVLTNVRG